MKTLLFLFLISIPFLNQAQNIELTIKEIESTEGYLLVGIFVDEESFKKEIPFKELSFSKRDLKHGKLKVNFFLEQGTYGISLFDDKNNNKEMDFNFFKIPKEGFGFSNYYHMGLKRPQFDDFKFYCNGKDKQKIEIIIRYI